MYKALVATRSGNGLKALHRPYSPQHPQVTRLQGLATQDCARVLQPVLQKRTRG